MMVQKPKYYTHNQINVLLIEIYRIMTKSDMMIKIKILNL